MSEQVEEHAGQQERVTPAPGKRLLMEAALRLSSTSRSLSSIGLRELAREAGLNPNTFYRHFQDIDDLGLAVIADISEQLRAPLRALRREAAERAVSGKKLNWPKLFGIDLGRGRRVTHETVELFFDFVDANPAAFLIGVRELHGASPVLRAALAEVMEGFAADMAQDIADFKLLPANLGEAEVLQLSHMVSRTLFQQSLDYLGQPERRGQIRALAEEQILMQFAGAAVLKALGQLELGA